MQKYGGLGPSLCSLASESCEHDGGLHGNRQERLSGRSLFLPEPHDEIYDDGKGRYGAFVRLDHHEPDLDLASRHSVLLKGYAWRGRGRRGTGIPISDQHTGPFERFLAASF